MAFYFQTGPLASEIVEVTPSYSCSYKTESAIIASSCCMINTSTETLWAKEFFFNPSFLGTNSSYISVSCLRISTQHKSSLASEIISGTTPIYYGDVLDLAVTCMSTTGAVTGAYCVFGNPAFQSSTQHFTVNVKSNIAPSFWYGTSVANFGTSNLISAAQTTTDGWTKVFTGSFGFNASSAAGFRAVSAVFVPMLSTTYGTTSMVKTGNFSFKIWNSVSSNSTGYGYSTTYVSSVVNGVVVNSASISAKYGTTAGQLNVTFSKFSSTQLIFQGTVFATSTDAIYAVSVTFSSIYVK